MSRLLRATLAFVLVVSLTVAVAAAARGRPASAPRTLSTMPRMDLSGIVLPVRWMAEIDRRDREDRWYLLATAHIEAAARERAARTTPRGASSGGAVTGSCAAMAPPGFPGYIVERESGGDPNAVNSSSGAQGCAQILPSHFSGTCAGMSYAQCWAALWDNGRGASHWSTG